MSCSHITLDFGECGVYIYSAVLPKLPHLLEKSVRCKCTIKKVAKSVLINALTP